MASVGSTTISGVPDPRTGVVGAGGSRQPGFIRNAAVSGGPINGSGQESKAVPGSGAAGGSAANLSSPPDGGFAAALFAQLGGASPISVNTPLLSKRVSDAYQTASDLTSLPGAGDIQVPGLPPRLSSGRLLDLLV